MEYTNALSSYESVVTADRVEELLIGIREAALANRTTEVYKKCFGCIDLTSLFSDDSHRSIEQFTAKAVQFPLHFKGIPSVASICVYPLFVETVGVGVGESNLAITSVSGGFPASQTFLEVKVLETAMAIENGADEIDLVMGVGEFLDGEYDLVGNEIEMLREEIGEEVILKVILETGLLSSAEQIYKASLVAMTAGADFIKTSTGKTTVSATPEAAVAMCAAIGDYFRKTGRKVGFKAAGGISTAEDAVLYYTVVEQMLGKEWLTPELFRIGASSLANRLLTAIEGREVTYF